MRSLPELNKENPIASRLRIEGRVQGVWFRSWVAEKACALKLDGWVRNRRDGTVEALFSGPPELVRRMIDLCREGPRAARVDRIAVEDAAAVRGTGFEKRPTE